MKAIAPDAANPARRLLLSEQLIALRDAFSNTPTTLRQVIDALGGRAYTMLIFVLALPFAPPASLPGSSTPLGLIVALLAVQMAFGRLPWLPRRVLDWRLPAAFFTKLIPFTARIVRALERVLHPRWPRITERPGLRAVHFLVIVVSAVVLALPIPIPFTNTLSAWPILLLACGLLERDGVIIAVGHLLFLGTAIYFAIIGAAMADALGRIWQWLVT